MLYDVIRSVYLSTNLYGSLSRDYVSKLVTRNKAAQTQNLYVILIPY